MKASRRMRFWAIGLIWVLGPGCEGGDDTEDLPEETAFPQTTTPPTAPSECPLFDGTACQGFLDGCWAPDLTGTCMDSMQQLDWSDGHKIVRTGGAAGLYGPSDTSPCITLEFDMATLTSTLTNVATGETLLNQDLGDGNILITCTDGTELTFTAAELEADNVCKGISCP